MITNRNSDDQILEPVYTAGHKRGIYTGLDMNYTFYGA